MRHGKSNIRRPPVPYALLAARAGTGAPGVATKNPVPVPLVLGVAALVLRFGVTWRGGDGNHGRVGNGGE
jgi:hypothetical protein